MSANDSHNANHVADHAGNDRGALRSLAWLVALACSTSAIAYLLWDDTRLPRKTVQFGVAKIQLDGTMPETVTARTRIVYINAAPKTGNVAVAQAKQIQLPDGRWVNCRGNCAATYIESAFH